MKRRRIKYVTVPKWRIGTIGKAEIVMYDTKRRPIMAMKMQRRKPQTLLTSMMTLKKNPDKVMVGAIHIGPSRLQVYYYKHNPFYFHIAIGGEYVGISMELADWLIRTLQKLPRNG